MKIVYRAGDITEAEIVKGMLLSNGIEAHVSGYYLQGGIGELGAIDLAKVHVPDEDYQNALQLVLEYEGNSPVNNGNVHDSKVEKSTRVQKAFTAIVVIIVVSILGYWFGV